MTEKDPINGCPSLQLGSGDHCVSTSICCAMRHLSFPVKKTSYKKKSCFVINVRFSENIGCENL